MQGSLTIIDSENIQTQGSGVIKGGKSMVEDSGGAFTVEGGILTLNGGTIQDCAGTAGAVWMDSGSVFNLNGATIRQTDGLSAAVVVSGGSTFNMSRGFIQENKALSEETGDADTGCAAVCVKDGEFNMSGGFITDNDIIGVRIGENGSFAVSGSLVIDKNRSLGNSEPEIRNVYLAAGQTINVAGELGRSTTIGVTVEGEPVEGEPTVITSGLEGNGGDTAFVSDNEQYSIMVNNDKEVILGVLTDSADTTDTPDIPVESVEISPGELTLAVGQEATLSAILYPENATNDQLLWLSNNTGIASVNYQTGKVKAVSAGTTSIVVFTEEGQQAECPVTVTPSVAGSVFSRGAGIAVGVIAIVLIVAVVIFIAARKKKTKA